MSRYAVLPGHEYKAFIPYDKVFLVDPPKPTHIHLYAQILSLRPHHVRLSRSFPELGFPTDTIAFDYAIYALGSHLPPPLNLWDTSKSESGDAVYTGLKTQACDWFKQKQAIIKDAPTVLVVGGGALGIQFATDIKSVYPEKEVTLLHSRLRLLPRFGEGMHDESEIQIYHRGAQLLKDCFVIVKSSCENMGVKLILGERLDLGSIENGQAKTNEAGQKVVRTVTGREIAADLLASSSMLISDPYDLYLLCTGQTPNTGILKSMDPSTVSDTTGLVRVLKTMQIHSSAPSPATGESDEPNTTTYPHIFAIGDAADAFGAIPAGHNAYSQGELASRNIIRLIKASETSSNTDYVPEPLEDYTPGPPAIKVSLGLTRAVYQVGPSIGTKDDGVPDLQAALIWPFFGIKVEKEEDMIP
ncbi:Fe-regulated protein 8 [Psilocybe cubensis]|uniref:Fe-regulated protein 8 n=1 Tax=Psilocybe cubensis TaxID=181762 RepID=A0ACB8GHJ1_PSICU|nr:Fe-regulated protein 8 [Psilocybe cubensis]KAH9475074.1 Fe-regulated protein 8 [Psilocybe cubensis]